MILSMVQFTPEALKRYLANPKSFEDELASLVNGPNRDLYLDKSWDAINYILTGNTHFMLKGEIDKKNLSALEMVIYSAQYFDKDQNLGLGPAGYLSADQVKEIDKILQTLDPKFVKQKYNPKQMMELDIYPRIWNEENLDYVKDYFQELKMFYSDAAAKGNAIASFWA